jgi:hypothetical protein
MRLKSVSTTARRLSSQSSSSIFIFVVPAQTGNHLWTSTAVENWVPACAGMTENKAILPEQPSITRTNRHDFLADGRDGEQR